MSALLDKKAQLKIQQMVFMLLAITLFFILVGMFYLAIKVVNLESDVNELNRDKAVALVSKIASNPEFVFENVPNAVDADKLMILKDSREYDGFFGVDGIIVQKIYPEEEEKDCTIENYPDCTRIKLFTNKDVSSTRSFVSWCRKNTLSGTSFDDCSLAILMIDSKEVDFDE
jgi:hypothetical protein